MKDIEKTLLEIKELLDSPFASKYELYYPYQIWERLIGQKPFELLTKSDLHRALTITDGFIGVYSGIHCYIESNF